MNFVVVDIECFSDSLIKEISFSSQFFNLGYSFVPPQPFTTLPLSKQKQNLWLTRNLHGITWESGSCPAAAIHDIIKIFNNSKIQLYAKGESKIKVLDKYFPDCHIVNLDAMGCPNYAELARNLNPFTQVSCSSYPQAHNSMAYEHHCAQRKGYVYAQWLFNALKNSHDLY